MTTPDPSYITADEVEEQTQITALADLETEDIEYLITTAEDQIDAYCGRQAHHPFDTNLDRVFPREQDYRVVGSATGPIEYRDTPEVPYNVSKATLRQVEWLYTQWWSNRATELPTVDMPVESRSIGGDGSYDETFARGGLGLSEASVCDQAKLLLKDFKAGTAQLSVTKPDDVFPRA